MWLAGPESSIGRRAKRLERGGGPCHLTATLDAVSASLRTCPGGSRNSQRVLSEAPVRVRKERRSDAVAHAVELLERLGLADKQDSYSRQLSGGQQQRVAIARAIAVMETSPRAA